MKASLFSLISVWQRGWSWRCFRYRPLRARLCLEKKINKLKSPSMQAVCSTRFASDPKWPDTFGLRGLALTLLIFFWKLIEMGIYIVWHHFSFCETGIRHRCESLVFSNCQEKNFPLEDLRTSSEHRNSNLEITFYCTEDAKLPSAPIYNKKVKHLPRKEPCGWNDINIKMAI